MTLIDLDEARRTLSSMADAMERDLGPENRFLAGWRRAVEALDVVRPVSRDTPASTTSTPTEE